MIDDERGNLGVHGTEKTHAYDSSTFSSEHQLVTRFLDDLRAAESLGAEVVGLWAAVANDPALRGGLRTVQARERSHGELLARRLDEIGGVSTAELSAGLRQAASAHLASTDVPDLEKLRDFVARYPDTAAIAAPIREVISQIEDDLETKALLSTIADDEMATQRWMAATFKRLAASSEHSG